MPVEDVVEFDQDVVLFKRDHVLEARDLELAEMHGVNLNESRHPRTQQSPSLFTLRG